MTTNDISTEDVLLDLRCKGELELHVINLGGLEFICRPLSYQQYLMAHQVLATAGELEAHELVIKITALHPERKIIQAWLDEAGDEPDELANEIITLSCFDSQEGIADLYDEAKEACNSDFMSVLQIYITKALGISPIELEKLSLARIMGLLAKAEHVLETPLGVRQILGLEEGEGEGDPGVQLPIAPGMQTTDPAMTKEFMLDPRNSSPVPPEAFGN